jgi:hypothetical protein
MTNVDLIFVAIGIAVLVGLYFFYRGRRHTRRLFTALPRGKPQSSEPCHFLPAAGFSGLVCRAKEAHQLARILIFSIYDRRVKHPLSAAVTAPRPDDIREKLERRLGRLHARQRSERRRVRSRRSSAVKRIRIVAVSLCRHAHEQCHAARAM